jgi:hypothetical protein
MENFSVPTREEIPSSNQAVFDKLNNGLNFFSLPVRPNSTIPYHIF